MNRLLTILYIVFVSFNFSFAESPQELRLKKFPHLEPAATMVEELLLPQGMLHNASVIDVMKRIPRHRFIPPEFQAQHWDSAYWDQALSIGHSQTISPPFIVAYMTEQIAPKPADKVLEIGTGSGYQAAVLSLLVDQVYSIEIVEPLGTQAAALLKELGMDNVHVRIGDGYKGWPEAGPFDSIIVTCSPEAVPKPLIKQLKEGGKMIIPVGERYRQTFYLGKKINGKLLIEQKMQTLFVPMTGKAETERTVQPDPKNPHIVNGNFQEINSDGTPAHWHYSRNVNTVQLTGDDENYVRFIRQRPSQTDRTVSVPGFAQILQGLALDGKSVPVLHIEYEIQGKNVTAFQSPVMTPTMLLIQYDAVRNVISEIPLGRCTGTFSWRKISSRVPIHQDTREILLAAGLIASSGELHVRGIAINPE